MTTSRWMTVKEGQGNLLLNGVGLWPTTKAAEYGAFAYTGVSWPLLKAAGWRVVPVTVTPV